MERFDADAIKAELDAAGLSCALEQSTRWSRLYGGALTVIAVTDSGPPDQAMLVSPASRLLRFVSIPAERARPLDQDVGLMSPTYGKILRYQVTGIATRSTDVHHSRAIPHEPIKLPLEAQNRDGASAVTGWGPSVLDRLFDDLGRYGATGAHAVSMMYGASLLYMQLDGYRAEAQTKAGMARVQARADATRRALDSYGLLVMDSADSIGSLTHQLNGAGELMDKSKDRLAGATPYPREILFNESPAGLNAGELSGPQEIYFASVESWRKQEVDPGLRRAIDLVIKMHGLRIDSYDIEWAPLWTHSDAADSEVYARNAVADAIYIDKGVIPAEVVTEERFVRGKLGRIEIPGEQTAAPLELDPADVEAEEAASATPAETPADTASLLEIIKAVNMRELTYEQGLGALAVAFPTLATRAATVLGPPPSPGAPALPQPQQQQSTDDLPGDRVTVQEAAKRFGIKTRSITRLIEKRLIKFWGFGSHRVVSIAEVEAAAKAHEVEAEDPDDPDDQGPEDATPAHA